jgi:DNA-binding transcriptional LysR family regulator
MDTRFLETFLMAVDHGSIAEAARRLNLTGAAVAKRIHTLEGEIGVALVTRSGRTIRPTEAGTAIVDRARRFVIEARDFKSLATTDRPLGQLRLGAYSSALTGLLPDILVLMRETYPQIEIHVTQNDSRELYRMVLDGDLDAAVIAEPQFSISKSCNWQLLREEPLILLTRAPAPSRKPHVILGSEPFIRLDRNIWPGRRVDAYLRKAGIRPRELFELNGIEAIAAMVDRGLGVSLVPDWKSPWPRSPSLVKLPVPGGLSFARRVVLIWRRTSPRLRLVHAILEQATVACMQSPGRKSVGGYADKVPWSRAASMSRRSRNESVPSKTRSARP